MPAFAGMSGACRLLVETVSPLPRITATTAPTGATSPACTWIAASVPAAIAGTSIDTLSVSISNRLSPGFTASPALTNHFEIVPSATVSPSCGIRTSIQFPTHFLVCRRRCSASAVHRRCGTPVAWLWQKPGSRVSSASLHAALRPGHGSPIHRDVLRLHELQEPLVRALAAEAGLLGAAERRRRIGDKPAVEADHAEVELFGNAHA